MGALADDLLWNMVAVVVLAVLVALAGYLKAVRHRPALRHVLWLLVLAKFVTPPVIAIPLLAQAPAAAPIPSASENSLPEPTSPVPSQIAAAEQSNELEPLRIPRTETAEPLPASWRGIPLMIWLFGTVLIVAACVTQAVRFNRLLRRAGLADVRMDEMARKAASLLHLRRVPTLRVVDGPVSPLLWIARGQPVVVLPRGLLERLDDQELLCVIAHEVAHWVRRDHWANAFAFAVAALFWWHPVAWWARREMRVAQEFSCDALVIGRLTARRCYALALYKAVEYMQAERPLLPVVASGLGQSSLIRRRFEMIADSRVSHRVSWWTCPPILAVLAALLCVPVRGQSDESNDSEARARAYRPDSPVGVEQFDEINWNRFPSPGHGTSFQPWAQLDPGRDLDPFGFNQRPSIFPRLGVQPDPLGRYPHHVVGSEGVLDGVRLSSHDLLFGRDAHKPRYRLPDYLPAAHGNAVSAGEGRYYVLTPKGSDRVWYVQFIQDGADGFGKILWDATLKLPPADELDQGDTFALNTSRNIVTVAVVEDDYVNDRDIGIKQIDAKTGTIKDERTLLRHMARYQTFLPFMQGESDDAKENTGKTEDE